MSTDQSITFTGRREGRQCGIGEQKSVCVKACKTHAPALACPRRILNESTTRFQGDAS
jgi:hypothetical protein